MKTGFALLTTLLSVILATNSYADKDLPSSAPQGKENGWMQNGKSVPDSNNIKSKDGFGAQLWIIDDHSFFDNWNKPETPKVPITKTAIRNKPVFIIFLFINPGTDQESKANVTADVTITCPDGKVYGDFKDVKIWQQIYRAPQNSIQLAVDNLGVEIEDGEQLGTYKVEAKIKDKIKNIILELRTEFTAKDEAVNKITNKEEFFNFLTYYYKRPQPSLIVTAIRYMQNNGIPSKNTDMPPLLGFFADVFASNQNCMKEWTAEIDKTTGLTNEVLKSALKYSQSPGKLTQFDPANANPGLNDICWGAFFVNGKEIYLDALLKRLSYLNERKSLMLYLTAASAEWSLSSNARQHPKVKAFLEAKLSDAPPDLKTIIKEMLEKSPADLQESVGRVVKEQHEKKVW